MVPFLSICRTDGAERRQTQLSVKISTAAVKPIICCAEVAGKNICVCARFTLSNLTAIGATAEIIWVVARDINFQCKQCVTFID